MNKYFKMLINSPFIRARILSGVRAAIMAAGATMVTKGYADDNTVTLIAGAVTSLVGFWLGDLDVKLVDKKIEAAANMDPPTTKDEIEQEITRQLNKNQTKIGAGKAGW